MDQFEDGRVQICVLGNVHGVFTPKFHAHGRKLFGRRSTNVFRRSFAPREEHHAPMRLEQFVHDVTFAHRNFDVLFADRVAFEVLLPQHVEHDGGGGRTLVVAFEKGRATGGDGGDDGFEVQGKRKVPSTNDQRQTSGFVAHVGPFRPRTRAGRCNLAAGLVGHKTIQVVQIVIARPDGTTPNFIVKCRVATKVGELGGAKVLGPFDQAGFDTRNDVFAVLHGDGLLRNSLKFRKHRAANVEGSESGHLGNKGFSDLTVEKGRQTSIKNKYFVS